MSYGSSSEVLRITGIRPSDLKFEDDAELTAWLDERLEEISAMIVLDRRRDDFEEKGWLPIVNNVANRWAAEFIRFVMMHRDSPIVRIDDFQVEAPSDNVPGRGIMRDLRRIPRKLEPSVLNSFVPRGRRTDAS